MPENFLQISVKSLIQPGWGEKKSVSERKMMPTHPVRSENNPGVFELGE